ncbi:SMC-Scp complex subunit ScpB [Sphingobacterium sp. UT-1RO-CII-1]|uniref:SMC-Scp complex subunit ScpB n=1 Tax=Sphingobacterium sp. UT-1RO-CII-1 TaxID=2995225 RepID=UPI00227AE77D|nr:SMC-Scp complex subunit ScpB [Sphingobacterium sp. UT-1RO-CII-1]MCY4779435.1 SMC-Scp complex subunit ScpB [Sphingobacterium sp. UT-1RO-CII-1]
MKDILLNIEALLFASEEGVSINDLKQVLQEALSIQITKEELTDLLDKIKMKYRSDDQVFDLRLINNHYQFLTKELYHEVVNQLQAHKDKKKLSQAALETLAIIAYRQPITKLEVEQIRGVNCDYSIQRLLERKLITIAGKADSIGKPLIYATSDEFMNHFGINSAKDLPQLKDIITEENSIGEVPV